MKLTWHIVKKDLRRFWIGSLLLVGIIGMKFLLMNLVFHLEMTKEWEFRMREYQSLLLVAELIFSLVLAAATVQEDPVSEPGAFWQTLPLTRRQLLGAKVLSVILICVLPVVLTLAFGWLWFDLPANLMGWPLVVTAAAQLLSCLLAFAFGSLARNMAHLLFWITGVVLAFSLAVILIVPFLHDQYLFSPSIGFTHRFLANLTMVITCLAIILNQYLAQSKKRSIVFLAAGMVLMFEMQITRFPTGFDSTLQPGQSDLDHRIAMLNAKVVKAEVAKAKPDSDTTDLVRVSIQRPNGDFVIYPTGYVEQWMQLDSASSPVRAVIYYRETEDSLKRPVEQMFGFSSSPEMTDLNFGAETAFPGGNAKLLIGRSTPYQAHLELNIRRTLLDGQMELAKGASLHSDLGTSRIRDVSSDGSVIKLDVEAQDSVLTRNDSALMRDKGWIGSIGALGFPPSYLRYALVNTKTRTVLAPARTSVAIANYAYGICLSHSKFQYVVPQSENNSSSLANWVLVKVRFGESHDSIKAISENVVLKEVPVVERDAAWTK